MKTESLSAVLTMSRGKRIPSRIAILAMTTVLSLAGCSSRAEDRSPQAPVTASNVTLTLAQRKHIHIHTVSSSSFRRTIDTTGVVDFDNDQATAVVAPIGGPVVRLLVALGDRVRQGQPLALVDSPDFAAAISSYRKAVVAARTASRIADRDKDLLAHHGVSEREYEQAQSDAASAEADRDAALQTLVSLNIPERTIKDIQRGRQVSRIEGTIRAPIAGTVVEKLITPGQLLQAGVTPCFTVADLSRVWVMARIFGSDIGAVSLHDPADVVPGFGSKVLTGTVTNIAATVDPDSRSVIARVAVANPGDVLKKQMYVRVLIHSRQPSTGLLVPVSAILRDDENLPFVYLAQGNGSFARRRVTLGYRDGDRYVITKGLRAGDQVVVDGGIFVQFMQNQ